jgi:hypothetical protein
MSVIRCSAEKPWGVHTALQQNQCPRCGWEADTGPSAGSVPGQPALTIIIGGLAGLAKAAAA